MPPAGPRVTRRSLGGDDPHEGYLERIGELGNEWAFAEEVEESLANGIW